MKCPWLDTRAPGYLHRGPDEHSLFHFLYSLPRTFIATPGALTDARLTLRTCRPPDPQRCRRAPHARTAGDSRALWGPSVAPPPPPTAAPSGNAAAPLGRDRWEGAASQSHAGRPRYPGDAAGRHFLGQRRGGFLSATSRGARATRSATESPGTEALRVFSEGTSLGAGGKGGWACGAGAERQPGRRRSKRAAPPVVGLGSAGLLLLVPPSSAQPGV